MPTEGALIGVAPSGISNAEGGSEAEGVSPRLGRLADVQVRIPGSGAVQSLNVAVACGIVLAEACRGSGEPVKNLRK
jgi:tRNA(Leu) C34 or U34 (ribose-2'-O)-methylase TrmL